jgi:hypothetical protein
MLSRPPIIRENVNKRGKDLDEVTSGPFQAAFTAIFLGKTRKTGKYVVIVAVDLLRFELCISSIHLHHPAYCIDVSAGVI